MLCKVYLSHSHLLDIPNPFLLFQILALLIHEGRLDKVFLEHHYRRLVVLMLLLLQMRPELVDLDSGDRWHSRPNQSSSFIYFFVATLWSGHFSFFFSNVRCKAGSILSPLYSKDCTSPLPRFEHQIRAYLQSGSFFPLFCSGGGGVCV